MTSTKKVVAIVVAYLPDLVALEDLLDRLTCQVDTTVVVDNSPDASVTSLLKKRGKEGETCLSLGSNFGIATAQNAGIEWARKNEAKYIILFDQDSTPPVNLVSILYEAGEQKAAEGISLAAVGPRFVDKRRSNFSPFIRTRGWKVERPICMCDNEIIEVDYLIASGCLIPISALDKVGNMREDLFIDYVDIEWGLRAKFHGLHSFGVCAVVMSHNLGQEPISVFKYKFSSHSPLRHYYQFRNAIWMYRQPWLSLNWKLLDGGRLLLRYGFHALFATPRLAHLRMMTLGLWHGFRGRMGMLSMHRPKT